MEQSNAFERADDEPIVVQTSKVWGAGAPAERAILWLVRAVAPLLAATAGCITQQAGDDACVVAEQHVVECLGQVPTGLLDGCQPEGAAELVGLDCEALRDAIDESKTDGFFVDLGLNQPCTFNMQCSGDLVCRPAEDDCGDPFCLTEQRCRPVGANGQLCDSSQDCTGGLACVGQWIWMNGRCLNPTGPTDGHRVCSALGQHLNDCGVEAPEGLVDDCLSSSSWEEVVEALDTDCDRLAAAIETGLGLGDGFLLFGLGTNRACVFNFQCGGDFVCRPAPDREGRPNCDDVFCVDNQYCADLGGIGDYCDSERDCQEGLACMYESVWYNGTCTTVPEY